MEAGRPTPVAHVLHELAVQGPPKDVSSPALGDGCKVTVELATKGRGR